MSTLFSEILLKNITSGASGSEQIVEVTIRAWERFSDGNGQTDHSLFSWYADLEISGIEAAIEDIVPGQRYDWSNNPNNYFHADIQKNRHIIEGLGSTANTFAPSSDTSSFTIAIITVKLPYSPSAGNPLVISLKPTLKTASDEGLPLKTVSALEATRDLRLEVGHTTITATRITSNNEAPSALTVSASELDENIAGGSAVATLSSADVDAGDTFTYALVSGDGDADNSAFVVEGDQLQIVGSPDFESKSSYSIRLQTKDSGGLTFDKAFTLRVNDLKEVFVIQSLDEVSTQKKVTIFKMEDAAAFAGKDINTVMVGTKKKDKITGTSDSDILAGMEGKDVLKGGESADGFFFNQSQGFGNKYADKIKDFDPGEGDLILLDDDLFSLRKKIKLNSSGSKNKVKKAAKSKNDFVYDKKKGLLYFNENGKQMGWGDGGLFAKLQGAPELGADDFTIV